MTDEDSSYRREEDRKWRKQVDHEQMTLMTGHQVLRDLVEDLRARIRELDIVLRGERGKSGLVAEYDRHDEKLTKLYAVIFQDSTGQKGIIHEVDVLMGRKAYKDQARPYKWEFWKAIIVAMITSGGVVGLMTHWSQIKAWLPKERPDKVEQMIENARNPKPRHRHIVIKVPSSTTEEENQESK